MLDQLLEERTLFIAHEAAKDMAHDLTWRGPAQAFAVTEFAVRAAQAYQAILAVHGMRERGWLAC